MIIPFWFGRLCYRILPKRWFDRLVSVECIHCGSRFAVAETERHMLLVHASEYQTEA